MPFASINSFDPSNLRTNLWNFREIFLRIGDFDFFSKKNFFWYQFKTFIWRKYSKSKQTKYLGFVKLVVWWTEHMCKLWNLYLPVQVFLEFFQQLWSAFVHPLFSVWSLQPEVHRPIQLQPSWSELLHRKRPFWVPFTFGYFCVI